MTSKSSKVLVTYASKHGSTAEIAQKIQEQLTKANIDADLKSVEEVDNLSDYDNVVIGAAVYMGMWYKPAKKFVKKCLEELSNKKVWIFSSGPTGKGDPVELMEGWDRPMNAKKEIEQINPVDMTVFGGNLDMEKLGKMEKFIIKKVKAETGDFRDWNMIGKWTDRIVEQLNTK